MSLVYDALNREGQAALVRVGQPVASAGTRYGVWLLVGVVLAGPAGFFVARGGGTAANPPPPAVAAAIADTNTVGNANVTSAGTTTSTDLTPSKPSPSVPGLLRLAPIVLANRQPEPAVGSAGPVAPPLPPDGSAPPAMASAAPQPQPAYTSPQAAPPPGKIVVNMVTAGKDARPSAAGKAVEGDPDPALVQASMAQLQAAVANHDDAARDKSLDELQALLPADSLTLLRARAWAAHGSGNAEQAERYYRAILQRVPDDEHAGVNLALINAKRGDVSEARDQLTRLAARNSRSAMVSKAWTELENAQP